MSKISLLDSKKVLLTSFLIKSNTPGYALNANKSNTTFSGSRLLLCLYKLDYSIISLRCPINPYPVMSVAALTNDSLN